MPVSGFDCAYSRQRGRERVYAKQGPQQKEAEEEQVEDRQIARFKQVEGVGAGKASTMEPQCSWNPSYASG